MSSLDLDSLHQALSSAHSARPLLVDSVVLVALQASYYVLSRRFLSSALPTLRQLSDENASAKPAIASETPLMTDDEDGGPNRQQEERASVADAFGGRSTERHQSADSDDDSDGASLFSVADSGPASEQADVPLLPLRANNSGGATIRTHAESASSLPPRVRVLKLFHKSTSVKRRAGSRGLGWIARHVFSCCFSESLALLTLVMFHSLGLLHERSLQIHFSLALRFLLLLILLVVPLVQCLQLTYRARDTTSPLTPTKRLALALVPFTLYIFLFTRIPPYVTTSMPPHQGFNVTLPSSHGIKNIHSIDLGDVSELDPPLMEEPAAAEAVAWSRGGWLEPSLGRVVVCGVVALGLLSGYGAIRTAYMFNENGGLKRGKTITREDVINAERSLYRVRHDQAAKREQLAARQHHTGPSQTAGWLGSWSSRGDREAAEISRELSGLAAVEVQVSRSLAAMRMQRQRQKFSSTLQGRIFNLVGFIFAIYCVARIVMCMTSILYQPSALGSKRDGDWISYFIALGLSQIPGIDDVPAWSRTISLVLTGALILSSLAQVLRSVSRILRLTSKSIGAGFLLLSLAQLMSTYVISLLIQLRRSLDGDDLSLLATLPDFGIFGRLFDAMFLVAALGSGVWRYASMKMNSIDEVM